MIKKKIVHLISSLKIGGAESLLVDLIQGLGTDHYEHHVVYFHEGPNVKRIEDLGVPVYKISGLVCLYDPLFVYRLVMTIKKIRPDLIHAALWAAHLFGRIAGKLLKIPIVGAVHLGVDTDGRVRNSIDTLNFGWSNHIIAVSQQVKESIQARGWIDKSRITVIRNGIDPHAIIARSNLSPQTRESLGLSSEHIIIGSVGRFIARKNFSLLLESFAHIAAERDNVRLMLVGLGPQEAELRALAHKLGVSNKVLFIVGQSAYGYFPLFDCFVLSSDQEGLSIALLEALSFSLACVVTSAQSAHELIEHGRNGLVIEPKNKLLLTQALKEIVDDKQLRFQLGTQGHKTLQDKFNLNAMIDAYRNVFERVKFY